MRYIKRIELRGTKDAEIFWRDLSAMVTKLTFDKAFALCYYVYKENGMDGYRTTIADIAEELGVSTATVSNVIHGKTAKISAATVKRVNELLEKRNYLPNMAGILLGQNNSRIIGVVINDHEKYESHTIEDGFISSALNALSREIDKAGYFVMVKVTSDWENVARFASMWNMVGLVIMGFCDKDYARLREQVRIPFVVVDGDFDGRSAPSVCRLSLDDHDGGKQVGKYLSEMGHSRVLCVTDNLDRMDARRIEGCADSFAGKTEVLVVPMQKQARSEFYNARLGFIAGFSAIFAVSDFYAAELVNFLSRNNIKVPDDMSVVGFDDDRLSEACEPPLTTVRQDIKKRAQKAVEILVDMTNGKSCACEYVSPVTLVVRNSVAAPSGKNRHAE